ncbi:unnamed protein product [Heterosigma akashiwo]
MQGAWAADEKVESTPLISTHIEGSSIISPMDANQIHSCQATAQSGGMVTSLLPEEKASPKGKELDLEGAPTGRRRVMSADLDVYESNAPENGIGGTMFLLLNTMIGSGILNQAQVFSEAGVIGTLLLYVAGGYTIHLGLELLIKAGVRSARLGFTELAHHAYGRRGDLLTDWTVILCNFGGLLSYFTVVGGQTCDILKDLVGASDGDSRWYTQEYAVLPVVVALAILPLCLTRRFGHFVYVSYLSISAIAAVVLCVLIAGPSEGKQYRSEPILWISVPGMAQKFGSVVFAIASCVCLPRRLPAPGAPDRGPVGPRELPCHCGGDPDVRGDGSCGLPLLPIVNQRRHPGQLPGAELLFLQGVVGNTSHPLHPFGFCGHAALLLQGLGHGCH